MVRKLYPRCARCNALLDPAEPVDFREKIVTRHRFNSGRDYKVKAHPRYHVDLVKCDAIYGHPSFPNEIAEANKRLGR